MGLLVDFVTVLLLSPGFLGSLVCASPVDGLLPQAPITIYLPASSLLQRVSVKVQVQGKVKVRWPMHGTIS